MSDMLFAPEKIAHNEKIVFNARIFVGLVFGILAGVLGVTGLFKGLIFYLVSLLFSTVLLFITLPKVNYRLILFYYFSNQQTTF